MRYLLMPVLVGAVAVLSTGPAYADLGDQLFKLLADDGAAEDRFGTSVGISGTTVIVGAWLDDDNGTDSGSAYLFDTTTGKQLFKLLPNDGVPFDEFGFSVSISGTTAIVGARQFDSDGNGSAYLFNTTTGLQTATLVANDGAALDLFGISVVISGGIAIVGAPFDDDNGFTSGSAYLFTTTGVQIAKLLANDGVANDRFGWSVAISGATAIVGALADDDNGNASGSAYLFDITNPGNPIEIAKLLPDDGAALDVFGISVAISGAIAIVGAPGDDDNGDISGSAYLFDISDPANPAQVFKLLPNDGAAGDWFGSSVAISGATAIVGAHLDNDNGDNSGSAYLFDISDPTNPVQIAKLLADDGAAGDRFGDSVAIRGDAFIVGASSDDDNGTDSGSAYLHAAADFDIVTPPIVDGEASSDPFDYVDSELIQLDGLAADGVTRIVARLRTPGLGDVIFKLRDENDQVSKDVGSIRRLDGSGQSTNQVTVNVVNVEDQDWAFGILQAPMDFARDSNDYDEVMRIIRLSAEFIPRRGVDGSSQTLELELHRPPVILLHGLWSNGATWSWENLQNDPRFKVRTHGYPGTNAEEFSENVSSGRDIVWARIDGALRAFRGEQNAAATQVDLVGHSMGGLLARLHVGEFEGTAYERDENFNEGDIHKLITLDTPHAGSPLTKWLVDENGSKTWLGDLAEHLPAIGCVDCGAAFDLRPGGIFDTIPTAVVPSHAVIGKGGSDAIQEGLEQLLPPPWPALLDILQRADLYFGTNLIQDLFPPRLQHDMVVGRVSQEGGLAGSQTSTFGLNLPFEFAVHFTVTQEDVIGARVIELLNARTSDASVFARQFPGGVGIEGGGYDPPKLPDLGVLIDGLVVTDPPKGTVLLPGDMVEVTVETTNGFAPNGVVISTDFGSATVEATPYSATFQVPVDTFGLSPISAFGIDANGDYAIADVVAVNVTTNANLVSIHMEPQTVYLYDTVPEATLIVIGEFDDGVERNISGSALGTTYESAGPNIATVDQEGVVASVTVGTTTITASNSDVAGIAIVEVVSVDNTPPCPWDLDGNGSVGATDLLSLLVTWGPCADCNDCPADFDGNCTVGATDLLALLVNWGPCP